MPCCCKVGVESTSHALIRPIQTTGIGGIHQRFAGQLELFSFEVRQAMEINSHENLTVAKLSAGRL